MDINWIPLAGTARRAVQGARAIGPVVDPAQVARSLGRVAQATAAPLLPKRSLESAVKGRVVLVTGASYGIGRAAALQIAANYERFVAVYQEAAGR